MLDFNKYFLDNREMQLRHIEYKLVDEQSKSETVSLECKDSVELETITEEKISFVYTRNLTFDPICLYHISISFNFSLVFNQEYKNDIKWDEIDFEKEIKDNKGAFIGSIISRASLQIAQITSLAGPIPIVTPPSFC